MFISSAMAETISIKNVLSGDSNLSQYFAQQFAALTPAKVVIALLMGLVVGLLIAFTYKKCYRDTASKTCCYCIRNILN